jgi:starvation-inducible outer membrane lipoprotein
MNDKTLSRRAVVAGLPFLLAGCSGGYRSIKGEPYSVPFVSMHPDLMRQEVAYGAPYRTGTVVVNIRERRPIWSNRAAERYAMLWVSAGPRYATSTAPP